MMKNFKALCLCILWLLPFFPAQGYEVFFVPGWRTGYHNRAGCVEILEKIYPGLKISVKSWNSAVSYPEAVVNSRDSRQALINELLQMPESRRRELILIGHSIGATIVIDVLNALAERGLKVFQAVYLATAIPDNDPRILRSLDAVRSRCLNIYSPDDGVLKLLYPLAEGGVALGSRGWRFSHPRFRERRGTKRSFSFFNHYAYLYIEDLALLEASLEPWESRVVVPGEPPAEIRKVQKDDLYWHTIRQEGKWVLQRHYLGIYHRIVDNRSILRACGSKEDMLSGFEEVVRQLRRGVK